MNSLTPPACRASSRFAPLVVLLLLLWVGWPAAAATVPDARQALLDGDLATAIPALEGLLAGGKDPELQLLLCRAFYAENHIAEAQVACTVATSAPHPTSDAFLWLGRVQGARASRANPLSAFALARDVRSSFERSVALDPANLSAVSDLGEFYVEAPAIVGGGLPKARALAQTVMAQAPRTAHDLLGMAFAEDDDVSSAEREYRAAIASAHEDEITPAWMNLARLFFHHDRPDDAVRAIQTAVAADHTASPSLADAASLLMRLNREPDLAIRSLRRYLASADKSDDAPAFKAHLRLATLLAAQGDQPGAQSERAIAHRLAPDYQPAHDPAAATKQVR